MPTFPPSSLPSGAICMKNDLGRLSRIIDNSQPCRYTGMVTKVTGFMIESMGPQAMVGELCKIFVPGK